MEIIGLLGHQGVGKNYIAENILLNFLENKPTVILAFADHFKIDSIAKHNLNFDKVYKNKDYETRRKLQKIGTEEGRNKYGPDIWIKIMHNWIKVLFERGIKRFIICDLRFQNEVNWVKSMNGIVLKINAPLRYLQRLKNETNNDDNKIKLLKSHSSEYNIDKIQNYDIQINNNPGDDVVKQLSLNFKQGK